MKWVVVRNKARLVAQGHKQEEEEGIDYDEVFAHVATVEAIMIFLAVTSFMGFIVYQMDVKSVFLYGKIEEEVYDKYVDEILKKFDFSSVKTASTSIETQKPLVKNEEYLKGQPKLGLWYPIDSLFDLEAYSDSDYVGANLDRKSTIGEYVDVANCYGQGLWIQNQMLDYGFNFMNTKIYIDNESIIRGGDSLVRDATTASLYAQQDSSNIAKIQSKATLNEPHPQGKDLGSGPECQKTMGVQWLSS
nr:copia protein [Tanacetum cinerariifolium]